MQKWLKHSSQQLLKGIFMLVSPCRNNITFYI
uniref:Uncharacterized protein n=1 Tax=Anguilla anguilla TaxID=7936 RepID=A0A0E9WBW3_ANGAN